MNDDSEKKQSDVNDDRVNKEPLSVQSDKNEIDDKFESSTSIVSDVETEKSISSPRSLRSVIGNASIQLSAIVNDNLIVARYITIVSIASLGMYAFINTPLFFRYKNVSEIPSKYFQRRKYITGRLMICHHPNNVSSNHNSINKTAAIQNQICDTVSDDDAVTCYIRHLSPIESMLSKSWLHWYWNVSYRFSNIAITTNNHNKVEESVSELIKVQIAGIQYPKLSTPSVLDNNNQSINRQDNNHIRLQHNLRNYNTPSNDTTLLGKHWIRKMSEEQSLVKCQFLGRKVPNHDYNNLYQTKQYMNKRPIPGMTETTTSIIDSSIPFEDKLEQQIAIVKLYYHPNENGMIPSIFQIFKNIFKRRIDLGESMIMNGYAIVSENGLYNTSMSSSVSHRIIDTKIDLSNTTTATTISKQQQPQLRDDVYYMDQLSRAEYKAAQSYSGIWNYPSYRQYRSDVIDEIQFQDQATMIQKIFRWIRGG